MNKLLTAILAALMVAGGLSAISGATAVPTHSNTAVISEGSAPSPLLPPCENSCTDVGSPVRQ